MRKNRLTAIVTIIFLLTISSCQVTPPTTERPSLPTPTDSDVVENIQVDKVSPEKSVDYTEDFNLPNCGGTETLSQTLGAQTSVTKDVQLGATVSATGGAEVGISAAAKVKVEGGVEATYLQEYMNANSILHTVGMAAAPKTHVVYTIAWEKQEFTSIVTYELNGEAVQASYTFIMNVPKIASSRQENCGGVSVPTVPIPTDPVPVATKSLYCSPLSRLGQVLEVTYDGTNITVKNKSDLIVSIRVSVDYLDPGGESRDPKISGTGEWVLPNAYFVPDNGFSMNLSGHSSAQVWAWDDKFNCLDNFWLEIN